LPLAEELNIDPYIIEKFLLPTNRDKALILGDHLFLSIAIPDFRDGEYEKQELKFIIGKNYIITATNSKNEGIEFFKSIFEDNAHFQKGEEFENPVVYSFLHMVEKVYENMIFELKNLAHEVDEIEKEIFSGNENKMVKSISLVNRKIIDFGKNISGHQET
jgi:Mg2+ and Co2+ transporter CorA